MRSASFLAVGSIFVGLVVLAMKYSAFLLTGSVALYSDALESIINVAAAVAALLAVRLAETPADRNHPYGHHKAEYLSAVLEGALIAIAALAILRAAYFGYINPQPLEASPLGLLINFAAGVLNGVWAWVLITSGKRMRSPALVADGKHLVSDVISSAGVLGGVVLVFSTGWFVLDSVLAALVALNLLWSGWQLMKSSVGGLMDVAPPQVEMEQIKSIISVHGEGAREAHDLRIRHAGRATFIEFHLIVSGELKVSKAHEICDRIEAGLKETFEGAIVTIHVEPEEKAKHSGIVVIS